jgi:hypothetical protein
MKILCVGSGPSAEIGRPFSDGEPLAGQRLCVENARPGPLSLQATEREAAMIITCIINEAVRAERHKPKLGSSREERYENVQMQTRSGHELHHTF